MSRARCRSIADRLHAWRAFVQRRGRQALEPVMRMRDGYDIAQAWMRKDAITVRRYRPKSAAATGPRVA
jgi:hypothetical protein